MENKHWFVLNYIKNTPSASPKRFIDAFNESEPRLELFAPMFRPAQVIDGKVVFKEKLLTYYYVFVRGTLGDVKALCSRPENGLSLMLDRGSQNRYGVVSETAMNNFKIMARIYANEIPFYSLEDVRLEDGDTIEVVDGPFAGLVGTYMPKNRSNKGNLILAANGNVGAVVWNIDAKYIRILRFADTSKRQYDILDSFIQKLLPILRRVRTGEQLTLQDSTCLAVFNRRMGAVTLSNAKHDAKLAATLMTAQQLLGDTGALERSAARFRRKQDAITNPWTRALIALLHSVMPDADPSVLAQHFAQLQASTDAPTAFRTQLLQEYAFHLSTEA